jgi:membrane-associated phospholipid phosphatase
MFESRSTEWERSRNRKILLLAWVAIDLILVADLIWLPLSRLTFVPSRTFWAAIGAFSIIGFQPVLREISRRTTSDRHILAIFICGLVERLEPFVYAVTLNLALWSSLVTFTYLATAAALPLQDAKLAAIDRALWFDWPTFVRTINSWPDLCMTLRVAYESSIPQLWALILILSVCKKATQLFEACAVMAIVSIVVAVFDVFVPAEGAYAFFAIPPKMASNLGPDAGSWHLELFTTLRDQASGIIDFDHVQGLVTFPSMHAAWVVVMVWSVRNMKAIRWPILFWNGVVMLSTIPVGGHYLVDIIAGTIITIGVILFVRCAYSSKLFANFWPVSSFENANFGLTMGLKLQHGETTVPTRVQD